MKMVCADRVIPSLMRIIQTFALYYSIFSFISLPNVKIVRNILSFAMHSFTGNFTN